MTPRRGWKCGLDQQQQLRLQTNEATDGMRERERRELKVALAELLVGAVASRKPRPGAEEDE